MSTSKTSPILLPKISPVSTVIQTIGMLWICTQKGAMLKFNFESSPVPWGSVKIKRALSKSHGPSVKTRFLSAGDWNWKIKVLLPRLSVFTPWMLRQICWMVVLKPSQRMDLLVQTFLTRHCFSFCTPASFARLSIVITSPSSSQRESASQNRVNSSESIWMKWVIREH